MTEAVKFSEDGYMDLQLEKTKNYIVTKWYGSSLAIFEESAFQKYIRKLDIECRDNNHGRSVIRYFLSAAVTMIAQDEEGWRIPPELLACIGRQDETVKSWRVGNETVDYDSMPTILLAAESHIDSAIDMTAKRHRKLNT